MTINQWLKLMYVCTFLSQNTIISRIGGKIKARVLLARAPTREIMRSRWGITAARATGNKSVIKVIAEQCKVQQAPILHSWIFCNLYIHYTTQQTQVLQNYTLFVTQSKAQIFIPFSSLSLNFLISISTRIQWVKSTLCSKNWYLASTIYKYSNTS